MRPDTAWTFGWFIVLSAGFVAYALTPWGSDIRFIAPGLTGSIAILLVIHHARLSLGGAGAGLFFLCWITVTWLVERVGLSTGFPFGHFAYTDRMAPFVFGVPVIVPIAYAIVGYCCHFMAGILLRAVAGGSGILLRILLTAALMVVWDICADPVRSVVEDRWFWPGGGLHHGIPLSNYFGWLLCCSLALAIFHLVEGRLRLVRSTPVPTGYGMSAIPIVFYAALGMEYVTYLVSAPLACGPVATDIVICRQSGLTALLAMGGSSVLALWCLRNPSVAARGPRSLQE